MTGNQNKLLLLFVAAAILAPAGLLAQDNHCVAQKSPKKMAVEAGKQVYADQCMTCHQADGKGASTVVSLVNSSLVTGNKRALIAYLINGKNIPAGNTAQNNPHLRMGNPATTNADISNVLTYIRRSFGNKASMVKVSEVQAVRASLVSSK
jgi:mono/diheme cytochrome c family protein